MPTGYERDIWQAYGRIAKALEQIADRMPEPQVPAPDGALTVPVMRVRLEELEAQAEAWKVVDAFASQKHSAASLGAVVYEQQVKLGAPLPGGARG